MGSKSALVSVGPGTPSDVFGNEPVIDLERSVDLARKLEGSTPTHVGSAPFDLAMWPRTDQFFTARVSEFDIICDRRLAVERPSELGAWVSKFAPSATVHAVFMHSGVDWAAFAVWDSGKLRRSLSVLPDGGILEDIGTRFSFEVPYWEGQKTLAHNRSYPLPFHPIALGNEALNHFFGFSLEGRFAGPGIDLEEIQLPKFQISARHCGFL